MSVMLYKYDMISIAISFWTYKSFKSVWIIQTYIDTVENFLVIFLFFTSSLILL